MRLNFASARSVKFRLVYFPSVPGFSRADALMKFIIKSHTVIVDDEDAEFVKSRKWNVKVLPCGRSYAYTNIRHHGKRYQIMLHHCVVGRIKGIDIDHKNRNSLDNRRENLRFATRQQNSCNSQKRRTQTSSKFRGVCWNKRDQKWKAYIKHHQRRISIGNFTAEVAAAKAYNVKSLELHGEFASLNIIPEYTTPTIPAALAGGFSFKP